jgi:hypothetical protein
MSINKKMLIVSSSTKAFPKSSSCEIWVRRRAAVAIFYVLQYVFDYICVYDCIVLDHVYIDQWILRWILGLIG